MIVIITYQVEKKERNIMHFSSLSTLVLRCHHGSLKLRAPNLDCASDQQSYYLLYADNPLPYVADMCNLVEIGYCCCGHHNYFKCKKYSSPLQERSKKSVRA